MTGTGARARRGEEGEGMIREQETTVRFHVWGSPELSEGRVRLIGLANAGMT